jgi:hypothetical protein
MRKRKEDGGRVIFRENERFYLVASFINFINLTNLLHK